MSILSREIKLFEQQNPAITLGSQLDFIDYGLCTSYKPEIYDNLTEKQKLAVCERCPVSRVCAAYVVEVGRVQAPNGLSVHKYIASS
jgi:hypothetical protein